MQRSMFTGKLNEKTREIKDLFIGIDVHKRKWVVTVRTYDLELTTFTISSPSAEKLERYLKRNYADMKYHLVYEAGFSGYSLYDYFHERGIDIIVTPPNRIHRDGSRVKTDTIDSRKLAVLLSRRMLRRVCVPSPKIREYRSIFQMYDRLTSQMRSVRNRIRSLLDFLGHPLANARWSKRLLDQLWEIEFTTWKLTRIFRKLLERYEFLQRQSREMEEVIREIADDEELGDIIWTLRKIKGFGLITAIRLTVFLFSDPSRFPTAGSLVHYLGLTPSEHSSGGKERKGGTGYTGDRRLRSFIIELSWRLVRRDVTLLEKFESVYSRTGSKSKAIVAVARKLMVRIYTVIQRREEYVTGLVA